jgi:hypothetical protein
MGVPEATSRAGGMGWKEEGEIMKDGLGYTYSEDFTGELIRSS